MVSSLSFLPPTLKTLTTTFRRGCFCFARIERKAGFCYKQGMTNKERHKIVPAAYIILRDGNKILLQRRLNTGHYDGSYGFVSGHVEENESYSSGIIREALEEAGFKLKPEYIRFAHFMHRKGEDSERADVFFVAGRWDGEVQNMEPHKCDDLSWFERDNLPENLIPHLRNVLEYIDQNIIYSEHGWE